MSKVLFLVSAVAISLVAAEETFLQAPAVVDPRIGKAISSSEKSKLNGLRSQISDMTCDFYDKFDEIFDYCGPTGYV